MNSPLVSLGLPAEAQATLKPTEVTADLTTEIRWFFDGRLPPEVLSWFTRGGVGLVEDRCDRYRLDGEVDIGVKRRSKTTLELKLRQGRPKPFVIKHDLDGRLETWERWSPADGRIYLTENTIWIDIDKSVIKRRFSCDGHELPLTEENRALTGAGCDVEIATVSVNDQAAWTFAFAAFGPPDGHRRSLQAAWETLVSEQPQPRRLRLQRECSCGYPEWMAKFFPIAAADQSVAEQSVVSAAQADIRSWNASTTGSAKACASSGVVAPKVPT